MLFTMYVLIAWLGQQHMFFYFNNAYNLAYLIHKYLYFLFMFLISQTVCLTCRSESATCWELSLYAFCWGQSSA